MIEKAPAYTKDDKTTTILEKLQSDGILKNIQDEYLYWDKIKYITK
jgi:hypothetical protein